MEQFGIPHLFDLPIRPTVRPLMTLAVNLENDLQLAIMIVYEIIALACFLYLSFIAWGCAFSFQNQDKCPSISSLSESPNFHLPQKDFFKDANCLTYLPLYSQLIFPTLGSNLFSSQENSFLVLLHYLLTAVCFWGQWDA